MYRTVYSAAHYLLLSTAVRALAHTGSNQVPIGDDWANHHMAEEHHITNFDATTFFTLHDYDSSGVWTEDEIRRTYGLEDESSKDIPQQKKDDVVKEILKLVDSNHDGKITLLEWTGFRNAGGKLPDFGLGSGHHHDDEYEYEIHHFEKYHDANTKEEDLTHPEDIAHFKKHELEQEAEDRQTKMDEMPIVEQNIPAKFRRRS